MGAVITSRLDWGARVMGRPQFLAGHLAEVSVPCHGALSIELLMMWHWHPPKQEFRERKRESKTEDPGFYNLIPAARYHHSCYMLLATQTIPGTM